MATCACAFINWHKLHVWWSSPAVAWLATAGGPCQSAQYLVIATICIKSTWTHSIIMTCTVMQHTVCQFTSNYLNNPAAHVHRGLINVLVLIGNFINQKFKRVLKTHAWPCIPVIVYVYQTFNTHFRVLTRVLTDVLGPTVCSTRFSGKVFLISTVYQSLYVCHFLIMLSPYLQPYGKVYAYVVIIL